MTPETLTVALGDRAYDIFFGRDIYPLFQEWICRFFPGGTVHVVTDRNVASIYGDDIERWLAGIPHGVIALPPGEERKNFDTVREIYAFLARGDAGRDSLVVAFGGGVVGDLAGFAAATYLRGIGCIQVPTTLLSQVDSSVGGKTGFNLQEGKNLVGAFHQPRAVFIDDAFLLTLDARNLRAGMAEVVKSGLAGDGELWERLCRHGPRWRSLSGEEWRWLIRRSVAFKASVVERDERESSLRRILNLGHTIGHAMEKAGGYGKLLHGEAVAMGLAWEAMLGRGLGMTGEELADRIVCLLLDMGYALDDVGLPLSSIAAAIGMDKKRVLSDVDLPVVVAPGRCELRRIPLATIRRELPAIRAQIRERTADRRRDASPEEAEAPVASRPSLPEGLKETVRSLEKRVSGNPRDNEAIALLAEAYRKSGNIAAAWETIHALLERDPSDLRAQRIAGGIGAQLSGAIAGEADQQSLPLEKLVFVEEEAYEIRAAEDPAAPVPGEKGVPPMETPEEPPCGTEPASSEPLSVATVTLADVYWAQGEREEARRIVEEILRKEPGNTRAKAWRESRKEEDPVEAELNAFLQTTAKEYGYDLSRYH